MQQSMASLDSLFRTVKVFPGIRALKETHQLHHPWSEEFVSHGPVRQRLVGAELSLDYLEFKFKAFRPSFYTCCLYKQQRSTQTAAFYDL